MELSFVDEFQDDRYLLLEVPSESDLSGIISGQIPLEFVSNDKDPIVLCTSSASFQVLEFDTSNTLFLLDGQTLISQHFSTFEMRPLPPPFLQLRSLFRRNPITEEQIKGSPISDPITFVSLFNVTLCSQQQFDTLLYRLCVVNLDGILTAPRRELQDLLVNEILQYSFTLSDWRRIKIDTFFQNLAIPMIEEPIMKKIVFAVLKSYSNEINENEVILNEKKVLRFIAETVLRNAKHGIISDEGFEREMFGLLPISLPLNKESLHGLFFQNGDQMVYIDEETLPIELHDRLEALFRLNRKWETKEIEPFFEFHVHSALTFLELITRYARLSDGFWMRK
jgi:hypothetical protein